MLGSSSFENRKINLKDTLAKSNLKYDEGSIESIIKNADTIYSIIASNPNIPDEGYHSPIGFRSLCVALLSHYYFQKKVEYTKANSGSAEKLLITKKIIDQLLNPNNLPPGGTAHLPQLIKKVAGDLTPIS